MRSSRLINGYLEWVLNEIGFHNYGTVNGCSFHGVIEALWNIPYRLDPMVPLEENVVENAFNLRHEYFGETIPDGLVEPVSNLEVMVDLARRYYRFSGEFSPYVYFVDMLCETNLLEYDDNSFNAIEVAKIIDIINYRRYDELGYGGLFPIKNLGDHVITRTYDARLTDLWRQMNMYWLALPGGAKRL